jgi:hypothetical protein
LRLQAGYEVEQTSLNLVEHRQDEARLNAGPIAQGFRRTSP